MFKTPFLFRKVSEKGRKYNNIVLKDESMKSYDSKN